MSSEVIGKSYFDSFFFYLLCLFPFFFVSGPLLTDLSIVIINIYFLISVFIKKDFYFFKHKFFKIFLIFYLYLVFNSIFVSGEFISIKSSLPYIRFGLFVFAISYLLSKNVDKINYLFYSMLIVFITLSFDAIVQKILGFNLIGIKMSHSVRVSSFFGDELILGSFISKTICLLLALTFYLNFKKKNFISIGAVIISVFPIILSAEKSAFALFIIFLFIFFTGLQVNLKTKLSLFVISISAIIIILFVNPKIKNRLIDQAINNSQGGEYIFSRVHESHYKTALSMFSDKPFLGHGPKMFRIKCSDKKYQYNEYSCSTHPHNFYIQLLAETGLIGFMFLAIFYLWIIRQYFKKLYLLFKKKQIDLTKYFLLSSLLIIFLPISPSGNFFNNWVASHYAYSIGLVYFFINYNPKKKI